MPVYPGALRAADQPLRIKLEKVVESEISFTPQKFGCEELETSHHFEITFPLRRVTIADINELASSPTDSFEARRC